MGNLTSINIEKEVLMHYIETANAIVQKHIDLLSKPDGEKISEPQSPTINYRLQAINRELTANAEKILNDIKAHFYIDCQKLQEHLFIIRKDYLNDFLKKTEFNLAF